MLMHSYRKKMKNKKYQGIAPDWQNDSIICPILDMFDIRIIRYFRI